MVISIFAVIVALVGVLMYALSANPKLVEVGRIMFFCGLLAVCLLLGGTSVRLP